MKKLNYGVVLVMTAALVGCSMTKKSGPQGYSSDSASVQSENRDKEAFNKATSLTNGWPESSVLAAREMIQKHGDPQETTSDSLIWRNVAPFKRVIVHKTTYTHRFPLMHQDALEHVVDYKAPVSKVQALWNYNGSIVVNRTKGEMSAFGENEAQNILSMNLAHDIMTGKRGTESARVMFGKETLNYMNGNLTAYTQVLTFGNQFQTPDEGESISNKIRWQGEPTRRAPAQNLNLRQAQEARPATAPAPMPTRAPVTGPAPIKR